MGRLIITVLAALAGWAIGRWLQRQIAPAAQPPMRTTQPAPVKPQPQAPAAHSPAPSSNAAPARDANQPDAGKAETKTEVEEQPSAGAQPKVVEIASKPKANGSVPAVVPLLTADASEQTQIEAYCMRCKEQRTIVDAHEEITAKGRRALRGICSICGAKMFRFLPDLE